MPATVSAMPQQHGWGMAATMTATPQHYSSNIPAQAASVPAQGRSALAPISPAEYARYREEFQQVDSDRDGYVR